MSATQKQYRQVGNTRIAIAATLKRPDNTVVDLTDLTVEFFMVNSDSGTVKVTQTSTGVTITDATNGEVQYSPVDADVDTVGTYHAYFVVIEATKEDTFPSQTGKFQISIEPPAES